MVKDKIVVNCFTYIRRNPLRKKIKKIIDTLESGLDFEDKEDIYGSINSAINELKEVI